MRILLTGATGLIGTEVMKTLAAAGHQVTATDRKGGEIPPGVEFILGELTDDNFVNSLDFNVDAIVHLGSIPQPLMTEILKYLIIMFLVHIKFLLKLRPIT